jgi:hypothetical protein
MDLASCPRELYGVFAGEDRRAGRGGALASKAARTTGVRHNQQRAPVGW